MSVLLRTTSPLSCPPRWTTPRSPERLTLGGRVAQVAARLGTPLMPWQRHVADVALELDPVTGLLVYRRVVLTVPRQSGKTTELLSVMVHRAQAWRRQRISYTAQTRLKARKKWDEEHVPVLEASSFATLFRVTRQIGQEAIRWRNGSIHGLDAPSDEAAHGDTLDLGVIDEAFSQVDARVEQGMAPAMITRPQPQLWVVSTAGKSKVTSPYLWGKIEAGRAAVKAGVTAGVAYFEWSAPDDADPADPATWAGCMPALGWTVTEEAIAAEFASMDLPDFRRAYLNQWPDDASDDWQVITETDWAALADPGSQVADPVAFAAAIPPDASWGAIAIVGRRADGLLHAEVIDYRPRTSWMAGRLLELQETWQPLAVVVDGTGPAGVLVGPLLAAGFAPLAPMKPAARGARVLLRPFAREVGAACAWLYQAATDALTLRHLDQPELAAALAGAQRRQIGDGAWAWSRKGSGVDISPLEAVTLALWGFTTREHLPQDEVEKDYHYDPYPELERERAVERNRQQQADGKERTVDAYGRYLSPSAVAPTSPGRR